MLKKMLCLLLAVLLCPVMALAEDFSAGTLSCRELTDWAESYIARALTSQPMNDPADSLTADGYEFVYTFATLYADTPIMSADTVVNAVVLNDSDEFGPRNVCVGDAMSVVLGAYYTENELLAGSEEAAVLYTLDLLPESAQWAQVNRDGQRVHTIQYAVHEQMATGGDGYSDMGVIYTMLENRVSAVRVYGLDRRISLNAVNDLMYTVMTAALEESYVQVPFSYDGTELNAFAEADLTFSGMNFLSLTPEAAVAALGEPMADTWMDNGDAGYIRIQTFGECEITYLFNRERTQGSVYMLVITADGLEGPRGVRIGDTFSSVYNRFRNGEGEYQEDNTEVLYGEETASFGKAEYGYDASALLRYGFMLENGKQVLMQLDFSIMELAEIMIWIN